VREIKFRAKVENKEGFAHFLGNASDDGIEVIGNIYENPELLK